MATEARCASCTRMDSSSWVKSPLIFFESCMSPRLRPSPVMSGAASQPAADCAALPFEGSDHHGLWRAFSVVIRMGLLRLQASSNNSELSGGEYAAIEAYERTTQ